MQKSAETFRELEEDGRQGFARRLKIKKSIFFFFVGLFYVLEEFWKFKSSFLSKKIFLLEILRKLEDKIKKIIIYLFFLILN